MKKILSTGGKEIILKVVAQAFHVFAMSVFSLPKGICKEITDSLLNFGGLMMKKLRKHTGIHGGNSVFQRAKVVWAFGTFILLT